MIQSKNALTGSDNTLLNKIAIPRVLTNPLPLTSTEANMRKKYLGVDFELKKKKNKLCSRYNKSHVEITNEGLHHLNRKRVDANGIPITKHKPKQKVTFIDKVNPNKQLLIEEYVESFKKYNISMSYPDANKDLFGGRTICCSSSTSCSIF